MMFATIVIGSLAVWVGFYIRGQMKNAERKLNVFLDNRELDSNASDMAMSGQLLALSRSTSVGAGPAVTFPEPARSAKNSTVSEANALSDKVSIC
jgi:hypothetical protein